MARDAGADPGAGQVAAYMTLTTLWLAAATWAWERRPSGPLVPPRAGWVAAGLLGVLFVVRAVQLPVAAVVLPPLLLVTLAAMRRLGRRPGAVATAPPERPLRVRELAVLAVVPLVAFGADAVAPPLVVQVTAYAVYAGTSLLAVLLWLLALRSAAVGPRPDRSGAGPSGTVGSVSAA